MVRALIAADPAVVDADDEHAQYELCQVGVIAEVGQYISRPGGQDHVILQGITRGFAEELIQDQPFVAAKVRREDDVVSDPTQTEAAMAAVLEQIESYISMLPNVPEEVLTMVRSVDEPGWLADLIIRRTSERRWTRRLCGGGALLLAAAALSGVQHSEGAVMTTLCNFGALFFLQVSMPTWWTVVAEISGKHGASMWGLMNSLGGLGVFLMNWLVGWIVDANERAGMPKLECWRPVFDGVAIALAAGAVCWLFVDATKPITARQSEP